MDGRGWEKKEAHYGLKLCILTCNAYKKKSLRKCKHADAFAFFRVQDFLHRKLEICTQIYMPN